jgi:8-oxo-dGTP diphosphatase
MDLREIMFRNVAEIDWERWEPEQVATLLFVVEAERVLLIRKKRGFGQGKINGPGGKLDPGETPRACALRETEEELCIRAQGVEEAGQLFFQFTDGFSIHGYVFRADTYEGTPTETDEAIPLWFGLESLPFEEMWEDDRHWFPHLLSRQYFMGYFTFEGDQMLDCRLELVERDCLATKNTD